MKYPLKQYFINISLTMMFVVSCTIIVSDVENLFDPQDPDYVPPETMIISGPSEDDTLNVNNITFTFRHAENIYWPDSLNSNTIPHEIQYMFRIDYSNWSPWTSGYQVIDNNYTFWSYDSMTGIHTITIENLEDGEHYLEVKSKYPTQIIEENWPAIDFQINVESGPEIFIYPGHSYIETGETFNIYVSLQDVVDLMGIYFDLNYDPTVLNYSTYFIGSNAEGFLTQSDGHLITFIEEDTLNGRIEFDLAIAGGNVSGVSGSFNLINFIFTHIDSATTYTEIVLGSGSTARDIYNNSVLQRIQSGIITVW